ncbi:MAG: hypothetical protein K8T25_24725, partial [Planctomycetia bacterium]|nr:hypothetical protein [Planctomycetia bacterium]
MNAIGILLAAAPNLAGGTQRAAFELGRIQSPLDWILPLLLVGPISWFVIAMYRRDCRELE